MVSRPRAAYFVYGRFNPPTKGHRTLIDGMIAAANRDGAKAYIITAHEQNANRNPLTLKEKMTLLRMMYPGVEVLGTGATGNTTGMRFVNNRGLGHEPNYILNTLSARGRLGNKFSRYVLFVGQDRFSNQRFSTAMKDRGIELRLAGARANNSANANNVNLSRPGALTARNISASLVRRIANPNENLTYNSRRALMKQALNLTTSGGATMNFNTLNITYNKGRNNSGIKYTKRMFQDIINRPSSANHPYINNLKKRINNLDRYDEILFKITNRTTR